MHHKLRSIYSLKAYIEHQRFPSGSLLSQKAFFLTIFLLLIGAIITHDSMVVTLNCNEVVCWCNLTKQLCMLLHVFLTSAVAAVRDLQVNQPLSISLPQGLEIHWMSSGGCFPQVIASGQHIRRIMKA